MICPACKGKKELAVFPIPSSDGQVITSISCYRCEESGEVPDIQAEWIILGEKLREERLSRKVILRDEANRLGISALTLSEAERGMIDPRTIKKV